MRKHTNLTFRNLTLNTFLSATSFSGAAFASEDLPVNDTATKAKTILSFVGQALSCCSQAADVITKIKPDTQIPMQRIKVALDTTRPIVGTVEHFIGAFSDPKGTPSLSILSDIIKDSKAITTDKLNYKLPENLSAIAKVSDTTLNKLEGTSTQIHELWDIDHHKLAELNLSKNALKQLNTLIANHNAEVTDTIIKQPYVVK